MKKDSYYFCSDISDRMNEIFIKRFGESEFSKEQEIKLKHLEDADTVDVERTVQELGEDYNRKVFVHKVNCETLPYSDASFDLYIASLSLMIVVNHHNQLSEAYRVLEDGGTAGFSVWGRSENSTFFTFFPEVVSKAGFPFPVPTRTNFHLNDKESLVKDMKAAGFKGVKAFYTLTSPNLGTSEELFQFYAECPHYKPHLSSLSEEDYEKVTRNFGKMYEEKFGEDSIDPPTWEMLIITGQK